jgi:hypothetical protein
MGTMTACHRTRSVMTATLWDGWTHNIAIGGSDGCDVHGGDSRPDELDVFCLEIRIGSRRWWRGTERGKMTFDRAMW